MILERICKVCKEIWRSREAFRWGGNKGQDGNKGKKIGVSIFYAYGIAILALWQACIFCLNKIQIQKQKKGGKVG